MQSTELEEYLNILKVQQEKNKYREMLYIPEVSDKKYRYLFKSVLRFRILLDRGIFY